MDIDLVVRAQRGDEHAFFDDMLAIASQSQIDAGLEPIQGTVELAP